MNKSKEWRSFSLPDELVSKIEAHIEGGDKYRSVGEFLRHAANELLVSEGYIEDEQADPVSNTLSDHSLEETTKRAAVLE
ncbi:MAG: hypothetical protein GF308_11605 [Candidatus Heimdallarchaeota archaeon]|nr:hypothetical protein [Candidatus Heimdallarchaeota archaeon]